MSSLRIEEGRTPLCEAGMPNILASQNSHTHYIAGLFPRQCGAAHKYWFHSEPPVDDLDDWLHVQRHNAWLCKQPWSAKSYEEPQLPSRAQGSLRGPAVQKLLKTNLAQTGSTNQIPISGAPSELSHLGSPAESCTSNARLLVEPEPGFFLLEPTPFRHHSLHVSSITSLQALQASKIV